MRVISAMPCAGGGELFPGHLAAVFVVRVAVRGVERLFQRHAAFAGEAQGVGAFDHDFIAGVQALGDLDEAIVLRAGDDGDFDKGALQFVVAPVEELSTRITEHRAARHGLHAGRLVEHEREFRAHSRAQAALGILHMEGGLHRAVRGVGICAEVRQLSLPGFVIARHTNVRLQAFADLPHKMLRHRGDGFHNAQVIDFHERLARLHGLALRHVHPGNEAGDGRIHTNDRRRIARLAALHPEQFVAGFALHVLFADNGLRASGDARADHGALGGQHFDATERERRRFKILFLRLLSYEADVLDGNGLQNDGVVLAVWLGGFLGTEHGGE